MDRTTAVDRSSVARGGLRRGPPGFLRLSSAVAPRQTRGWYKYVHRTQALFEIYFDGKKLELENSTL